MAFQDIPDFSFKGQVPMAAIIEAYRNKGKEQFQMQLQAEQEKRNKQQELMQTISMGASLTDQLVDIARSKQQAANDAAVTQHVLGGSMLVEGSEPKTPGATMQPVPASSTDSYKQELLGLISKANPKMAQEAMLKQQLDSGKITAGNRSTPIAIELPDGTQDLGYFDQEDKKYHISTGEVAPTGSKRSYKFDIKTDSEGNYQVISGASGKKVGGISAEATPISEKEFGTVKQLNQLPPKTRTEFQSDLSESKKDPVFREEYKKVLQIDRMADMLKAKNFVFDQKIGLQIAKTMGDSGNIAVVEAAEGKENKQLVQKANQLLETYIKTGKLTESNRKQILEAVAVMDKAAKKNIKSMVDMEEEKLSTLYPQLNKDFIKESLLGKSFYSKVSAASGIDAGDGFSYRIK